MIRKTRQLVCPEAGVLEWRKIQVPEPGPNEVLIRATFAAPKHGTELGFYKGTVPQRGTLDEQLGLWRPGPSSWGYPAPLGNMLVGVVEQAGSHVDREVIGSRVAVYSPAQEWALSDIADCWRLPEQLSAKSAVCLDPANFAFAAVRDGNVRIGDSVAVFGLGAIGLMAVAIARLAGANPVYAIDTLEERRMAALKLGSDAVFDLAVDDVAFDIKQTLPQAGADVAIEFRGSVPSLQQALRSVAFGGNVVMGAMPGPFPEGLDLGGEAHVNRPNLVFSRSCSDPNRDHPRWDEQRIVSDCKRLFEDGSLNGDPLVDRTVAFIDFLEGYQDIVAHPAQQIKLGVTFDS